MERYPTSGVLSTNASQQMDIRHNKSAIGQTVSPNKTTEQGPTNSKKKKAEGENCICSICLETIIDCNEQNEGNDAIYYEGECDGWLHRQCARLSKVVFKSFQNSDKPFYCPHCHINNYETQLNNMKSTITSLEQTVISLETQGTNLQQPTAVINNDQSQMNANSAVNQSAAPTIPPISGDSTSHIGSVVSMKKKKKLNSV